MRAREFIVEAKPETLGQGMLDKLFATYTKRDVDDNLLPKKFESGLEVANYIYQYVGPAFLIWTTKQYNQDQYFFLHDLPAWKSTLDEFVKVAKNRQYQIEKDINRYQDINQLRQAIQQAVTPKEQVSFYDRIIPRLNQYVENNEAKWLYQGKDYSIYLPVTWESSREASRACNIEGGGACVTLSRNYFDEYTGGTNGQKGTLVYTISQDNIYIAYLTKGRKASEFSNINNNHTFDLTYQLTNFPNLKPVFDRLVSPEDDQVRIQLTDDPTEQRKIAKKMVEKISGALAVIPEEFKDYELCKHAVTNHSLSIEHVPAENMTKQQYYELCHIAVTGNSYALTFITDDYITHDQYYELCHDAISNGGTIRDVDQMFITPQQYYKLCQLAISKDVREFKRVDTDDMSDKQFYELCKLAVEKDGSMLKTIADESMTDEEFYELCRIAVSSDVLSLRYVPEEFKDYELCKLAFSKHKNQLLVDRLFRSMAQRNVPDHLKPKIDDWLKN